MKVSILLLTFDRYDLSVHCLNAALGFTGLPRDQWELLACDQGSSDRRMIALLEHYQPAYLRQNEKNEGIAPMYNQLILRAKGEYLCIIDPDIQLPPNWLAGMLHYAELIPSTGLVGIHCVEKLWDLQQVGPVQVHVGSVFGTKLFPRAVVDKVGYFCEDYFPYGLEDSDFGERIRRSGFLTYYIPGAHAGHLGHDNVAGTPPGYRQMKQAAFDRNHLAFGRNMEKYQREVGLYIPAPELT